MTGKSEEKKYEGKKLGRLEQPVARTDGPRRGGNLDRRKESVTKKRNIKRNKKRTTN